MNRFITFISSGSDSLDCKCAARKVMHFICIFVIPFVSDSDFILRRKHDNNSPLKEQQFSL